MAAAAGQLVQEAAAGALPDTDAQLVGRDELVPVRAERDRPQPRTAGVTERGPRLGAIDRGPEMDPTLGRRAGQLAVVRAERQGAQNVSDRKSVV